MSHRADDATELTIDLSPTPGATQPPSVDPAALRRAMKYGQKARARFAGRPFGACEPALRAGWAQRGETTEWDWVRAAVRVGFEQEGDEV